MRPRRKLGPHFANDKSLGGLKEFESPHWKSENVQIQKLRKSWRSNPFVIPSGLRPIGRMNRLRKTRVRSESARPSRQARRVITLPQGAIAIAGCPIERDFQIFNAHLLTGRLKPDPAGWPPIVKRRSTLASDPNGEHDHHREGDDYATATTFVGFYGGDLRPARSPL